MDILHGLLGSLDPTLRTIAPDIKVTYIDMMIKLIFTTERNISDKNELFVSGNNLPKCVCA